MIGVRRPRAAARTPTGWQRGASPGTVGAVGAVLVVLVVYVAFTHKLPFLGGGYTVSAIFANSGQVETGSPVRIAGVNVGSVTGVDRGPGSLVRVTMQIGSSGLPIHADATAAIRPRLFFEGSEYVDLSPGSPSAPTLSSGATIPAGQTSDPVQIDQLLSTFDASTRGSLKTTLKQLDLALSGGGAQALRSTTEQLAPVLDQTALLTRAAQGTAPNDLSDLIASTNRVTTALAHQDGTLANLITSTNQVAGSVASRDTQLSASLSELDGLTRETPAALTALNAALPPLRQFSSGMQPALRIAPSVLTSTAGLLDQLAGLSRPTELPRLLQLLAPSLATFPALNRQLDQLFPIATNVLQCVGTRVVPVLDAQVPDGSLSSGRPAWQDLTHVSVGLASALQDFDGNGASARVLGAVGDQTVSTGTLAGTSGLFASAANPIEGTRPTWLGPGVSPPYRPDQECTKQAPIDLTATTGPSDLTPGGATGGTPPLSLQRAAGSLLDRLLRVGAGR